MKKWLLCVGVVLAFLFAVVPFLSADEAASTTDPAGDAVKPKPAKTPKPAPVPKLTDEQKEKAEELIKNLDNDDSAARDAAEEALKEMGVAVLPLVKKAATSDNVEVAVRADRIVEHWKALQLAGPTKVTIKLSTNEKQYKVGERIVLAMRFVNRNKNSILLPVGKRDCPWRMANSYVLTGPDGKTIEPQCLGLRGGSRRQQLSLDAGESITQTTSMSLLKQFHYIATRLKLKVQTKDPTFLCGPTGRYCFVLAKPGKYTLKLRFVAKGIKVQPQATKTRRGPRGAFVATIQICKPAADKNATPVKGLMRSNTVTFEIVK